MRDTSTAAPKVLVVVLTYNQEDYIAQTLESILAQKTDFTVETLVHDDASTDGTRAIIERFHDENPGAFRCVLQTENQYQKGIRIIQTLWPSFDAEYIAFLDGDDFWTDPNKLQAQVDYMERYPRCALCQTRSGYFDEATGKLLHSHPTKGKTHRRLFLEDMAEGNFVQTSATMFRRSALPALPQSFATLGFGDYPMFALMAQNGWIGLIDDEMVHYRIHDANMWFSADTEMKRTKTRAVQAFMADRLPPKDARLWRKVSEGHPLSFSDKVFARLRRYARKAHAVLKDGRL